MTGEAPETTDRRWIVTVDVIVPRHGTSRRRSTSKASQGASPLGIPRSQESGVRSQKREKERKNTHAHGHGIGRAIRAQSDDLLKVETGSLYPALHRLEKRGWLKSQWDVSEANQRAKYYRLTAMGKAQLSRERDRWSQLVHAIGRVMNPAPAVKE